MFIGWFTLHRDWLASEYWIETPYDRAHALMDLMGHARFKAGHVRLRGQRIDLGRGQVAWSQTQLANRWGWSVNKVRRFLSELVRDGLILVEGKSTTTVITLLNYDKSFDSANANTNQSTTVPTEVQAGEPTRRGRQTKEQCQQRQQRQPPKRAVAMVKYFIEKDRWASGRAGDSERTGAASEPPL